MRQQTLNLSQVGPIPTRRTKIWVAGRLVMQRTFNPSEVGFDSHAAHQN